MQSSQSLGGKARAQKLSPEQRQEIATQAATARWSKEIDPNVLPTASYQGELYIGDVELDCYVLNDKRRLFHKKEMANALGLKSQGGNAFLRTMTRKGISQKITDPLQEKIDNPIKFKNTSGILTHGYEAATLIEVCDTIIQADNEGKLADSQKFLARNAQIIIRSAAKLGIVALIDEATGYIADKRKEEYRELFRDFIAHECREWAKEFPDQFFDMIYRIYGLKRENPKSFQHPAFFGKFIRKYIYFPLAGSNGAILEELDKKTPTVYVNGGRKHKLHQYLSQELGLDTFRAHLWQVIGIGNASKSKIDFERSFKRAFPQMGDQIELDFTD
ncbi:MAG: hypothetical protein IPH06_06385 [Alphaproteobacteria bacterium]|nr:hypothetical protein [Alphaproteobacteria bacterium]QQS57646.1 MAG: hypothetical protein IPN28_02150 [Alphaproteobacteria bacterium]